MRLGGVHTGTQSRPPVIGSLRTEDNIKINSVSICEYKRKRLILVKMNRESNQMWPHLNAVCFHSAVFCFTATTPI